MHLLLILTLHLRISYSLLLLFLLFSPPLLVNFLVQLTHLFLVITRIHDLIFLLFFLPFPLPPSSSTSNASSYCPLLIISSYHCLQTFLFIYSFICLFIYFNFFFLSFFVIFLPLVALIWSFVSFTFLLFFFLFFSPPTSSDRVLVTQVYHCFLLLCFLAFPKPVDLKAL